jgi:hypothetical protein
MAQSRRSSSKMQKRQQKRIQPRGTADPHTDDPRQAIESGEPRLTGSHQDRAANAPAGKTTRRRAATTGKDSPEQAWESGRPEAMP